MEIKKYTSQIYSPPILTSFYPKTYLQGCLHLGLALNIGNWTRYKVSLAERVKYFAIGIFLLIPVINALAISILRLARIDAPTKIPNFSVTRPKDPPTSPAPNFVCRGAAYAIDRISRNFFLKMLFKKFTKVNPQEVNAAGVAVGLGVHSLRRGKIQTFFFYLGMLSMNVANAACRIFSPVDKNLATANQFASADVSAK